MIRRRKSHIYLVESQNGMLKIGVSEDPHTRAKGICSNSPTLCRLVAFWPGNKTKEQALHRRFQRHRSHCEWFLIGDDLALFVEAMRGRGLEEPIEDWAHLQGMATDPDRTNKLRAASRRKTTAAQRQAKLQRMAQVTQ